MSDSETLKGNSINIVVKDSSGHVGGPLYQKTFDPLDSPKLNKRGMNIFD